VKGITIQASNVIVDAYRYWARGRPGIEITGMQQVLELMPRIRIFGLAPTDTILTVKSDSPTT